jgi:hypothetical protein
LFICINCQSNKDLLKKISTEQWWMETNRGKPSYFVKSHFSIFLSSMQGPGDDIGKSYRLKALWFKPWRKHGIVTFSIPAQTSLGTHPASCAMGTRALFQTSPTSSSLI